MITKPVALITAAIVVALFTGCTRYRVTLNEQPIYTPPPLYTGYKVADQALQDCLTQTISDQDIVRPEQLKNLTCRYAGIASMEGLEHFAALQNLDVSHNKLRDITILKNLKNLQVLKLNDNPQLLCEQLKEMTQADLQILPPSHCG